MSKRLCVIVLLTMLCAALLPSQPVLAGGDWYGYVYNSETFELVRVHLDGRQDAVNLGVPAGYRPTYQLAFSLAGDKVAYCAISDTEMENNQPRVRLVVQGISTFAPETDATILDADLGFLAGCQIGKGAFNEDGTKLAVGVVNYYMEDPAADTTRPNWQLFVYDLATGTVATEINASANPLPFDDPTWSQLSIMPDVRYFAHDIVVFRTLPWGVGGMIFEAPAYMWNLMDASIAPIDNWGWESLASLNETGELFWLQQDASLPVGEAFGPSAMNNVVRVARKDGSVTTIYHDPTWLIADVQVINDGRQLALLLTGQDPNSADLVVFSRWIALDRAGQTSDLYQTTDWVVLRGAPGGYTMFIPTLTDPADFATRIFTLNYYTNGTESPLWTSPLPGQYWDFVWAMQYPAAGDLSGSFAPIQP